MRLAGPEALVGAYTAIPHRFGLPAQLPWISSLDQSEKFHGH